MTDIRSKGLKVRELDAYLAELVDDLPSAGIEGEEEDVDDEDLAVAQRTLGFLRKEITDLSEQLDMRAKGAVTEESPSFGFVRIWAAIAAGALLCAFVLR